MFKCWCQSYAYKKFMGQVWSLELAKSLIFFQDRAGFSVFAMVVVKTVIYKDGQYPPSLPIAVLVVFENYNGPTVDGYCVRVIPIVSNSNTSENLERIQVPLKLSWSITIHKSQGMTIPNAVIDVGPKEMLQG